MKVIAHSSRSNVLVDVSRRELANMVGHEYEDSLSVGSGYNRNDGFDVGTEYDVSSIFSRLRKQERVKEQLENCATNLEALASLIRTVIPVAKQVAEDGSDGGAK